MNDIVRTIEDAFTRRVYKIPDYQRGFSWGEKQWLEFWEDLELLPPGKYGHFLGTLVIRAVEGPGEKVKDALGTSYTCYEVIDGQQRLTTITILLKAIHDQMTQLPGCELKAEGIQSSYLYHLDVIHQPYPKLTLNGKNHAFYQANILDIQPGISTPDTQAQKRLLEASQYFDQKLQAEKAAQGENYTAWLDALLSKITSQLKQIIYQVDSDMDAGVIFETVNDRGIELSDLDLVKNYLIYVASKLELPEDPHLVEEINKTWEFINESLMEAGLGIQKDENQFLRVAWLMAYNPDLAQWAGRGHSIKNKFKLKNYVGDHLKLLGDLKIYLSTLRSAVTAYCDIRSPHLPGSFSDVQDHDLRTQVRLWSSKLARMDRLAPFLPLLIAVRIKADDHGKTYRDVVELCEKFSFRVYGLHGRRSNTGESSLHRAGYDYFRHKQSDALTNKLRQLIYYYSSPKAFQEVLKSEAKNWYETGDIVYLLYEYEHHLAGSHPTQMTWEGVGGRPKEKSVEHILPQTPTDPYWLSRFTSEDQNRWINDLGNLTLTFDNSRMSNKAFPAKRGSMGEIGCYAGSPFFIERELAAYPEWGIAQIQDRREKMEKWILERWHAAPPPVQPEETESVESILKRTDEYGYGPQVRKIHELLYRIGAWASVRKGIQYRSKHNPHKSLMTFRYHPEGVVLAFYPENFTLYPGIDRSYIDQTFHPLVEGHSWRSDVGLNQVLASLEKLVARLHPASEP